MTKFRKMPDNDSNFTHVFYCQGCERLHGIDRRWEFNGDIETPTISPSYLLTMNWKDTVIRCHSFIRNGKIEYLSDSTHKFSGKTVDLLHEDDWFNDTLMVKEDCEQ